MPPDGWCGPWLIERAHIVSKRRVEDRRVIVLLCSLCHRKSHGEILPGIEDEPLPAPSVGNMLWLKRTFDRRNYDVSVMRKHSVRQLPNVSSPTSLVMQEYVSRQDRYPLAQRMKRKGICDVGQCSLAASSAFLTEVVIEHVIRTFVELRSPHRPCVNYVKWYRG